MGKVYLFNDWELLRASSPTKIVGIVIATSSSHCRPAYFLPSFLRLIYYPSSSVGLSIAHSSSYCRSIYYQLSSSRHIYRLFIFLLSEPLPLLRARVLLSPNRYPASVYRVRNRARHLCQCPRPYDNQALCFLGLTARCA